MDKNSLITLSELFEIIESDEAPEEWDFQKEIICIYGLGIYVKLIKELKNFNGLLIPSSIYLDKDKIPLFDFSDPITDNKFENYCECKTVKLFYKKHIYSFGIISIIILSEKVNSFTDDDDNEREIKKSIRKKIKEKTSNKFIKLLTN